MTKDDMDYKLFTKILEEELIPAIGCTEPIALAYAAARAREILGALPDKVVVQASGNIIKNVKSVIVPNTGNLKGIPAAVSAGIVAGDAGKKLEVVASITKDCFKQIKDYMDNTDISVECLESDMTFDVIITEFHGNDVSKVRIANAHTNIVTEELNGEKLLNIPVKCESDEGMTDHSCLTGEKIWEYANNVNLDDVRHIIKRQIDYNTAIAEEGIKGDYGANIGKVILNSYGNDVHNRAKAMAAAGSDARMNGCELPVVINSGSGNQGITCCLPVVEYARELKSDEDTLYRALVLSNMLAIHIKSGIGRLSAYCSA